LLMCLLFHYKNSCDLLNTTFNRGVSFPQSHSSQFCGIFVMFFCSDCISAWTYRILRHCTRRFNGWDNHSYHI